MIYTIRLARLALSVLIIIILAFVGCQRSRQSSEADNTALQIALQPLSAQDALVVVLTGANGAPVTDATVALEGNMSHPGMVPVVTDAVADEADGSADGHYQLPFTFNMLGDWI